MRVMMFVAALAGSSVALNTPFVSINNVQDDSSFIGLLRKMDPREKQAGALAKRQSNNCNAVLETIPPFPVDINLGMIESMQDAFAKPIDMCAQPQVPVWARPELTQYMPYLQSWWNQNAPKLVGCPLYTFMKNIMNSCPPTMAPAPTMANPPPAGPSVNPNASAHSDVSTPAIPTRSLGISDYTYILTATGVSSVPDSVTQNYFATSTQSRSKGSAARETGMAIAAVAAAGIVLVAA